MNLDDLNLYHDLDSVDLGSQIDALADLVADGWRKAEEAPLSAEVSGAARIALVGQTLAADLMTALYSDVCRLPLTRLSGLNDSRQPAWLGLLETLVVQSDEPAERSAASSLSFYSSVGWLSGMLYRCGQIAYPGEDVKEAIAALHSQSQALSRTVPAVNNPAKRMAGQLIERLPVIHGAGILAVVAHRWKRQLNTFAKNWAHSESTLELIAYGANGLFSPQPLTAHIAAVFIRALSFEPPDLAQRTDRVRDLYMHSGIAVDTVVGQGNSVLAQALTLAQYGEYVAYYVAVANRVDPSSLPATAEIEDNSRA